MILSTLKLLSYNNVNSLNNKTTLLTLQQNLIIQTRKKNLIRLKRSKKQKKIIYFILINSIKKNIKLVFGMYSYRKTISKKLVNSKIFINLSPGMVGFKKSKRRTKHAVTVLRKKFLKLLQTNFKKIINKRRIILRLRGNMKRIKLILRKLLKVKMNIRHIIYEGPISYNGIRLAKKKRK